MIGIIDESTPWLAGDRDDVLYALALVVIAADVEDAVGVRLRSSLNRKRPFHWESDAGPSTIPLDPAIYISTVRRSMGTGVDLTIVVS